MDGEVKAISLAGIVHNETKIGVQDGMCEDLMNLRYKDGSWRTAGPGKGISLELSANGFSQFYIHTNVYRHLLGVKTVDGKDYLYWTAVLDADGNFYVGAGNEDQTKEEYQIAHEVFYGTGSTYTPVQITEVHGKVSITQTGHMLTIIDEEDDFEYFVYKTSTKQYVEVNVDVNGKQGDRHLYPFGQVHFNWHSEHDADYIKGIPTNIVVDNKVYYLPKDNVIAAMGILKDNNRFIQPMLAVAAVELYDGSFVYASNPVLINPCDKATFLEEGKVFASINDYTAEDSEEETGYKVYFNEEPHSFPDSSSPTTWVNKTEPEADGYYSPVGSDAHLKEAYAPYPSIIAPDIFPDVYANQVEVWTRQNADNSPNGKTIVRQLNMNNIEPCESYPPVYGYQAVIYHGLQTNRFGGFVRGYDLTMSLENKSLLENNKEVFNSICIFVSKEVDLFDLSKDDYERDIRKLAFSWNHYPTFDATSPRSYEVTVSSYMPKLRAINEIEYDLVHSPFYLLKRYDAKSINDILSNPVVDLSGPEDKGIVGAIATQTILTSESMSRTTYLPKVSYNYNGRLHIANYKAQQFHGYPLTLFQKNNHSVKYEQDGEFMGMSNIVDNLDEYIQTNRTAVAITPNSDMVAAAAPAMIAMVEIETSDGTQQVVRYIDSTDVTHEDLDAILTFPDYRAKAITVYRFHALTGAGYVFRYKRFELKPHPYLNMAYYLSDDMKPIKWSDLTSQVAVRDVEAIFGLVEEQNAQETYPNGLKVSSTEDPMHFPAKATYQVGGSEILALCSNTIAVGTGQTGDAPLYVFCKDGVYALFVDASGQMVYPNARAIARDVLNNPKSVTPIDAGVVFTTDRGLMMIAGEQVEEIGQPLEGDYDRFADSSKTSYNAIAKNAFSMQLLANLPIAGATNALTQTDFLTYLKGSVINYNHNERELMVSNPSYNYTYILDRAGNWSRRNYSATEYINNYPSSYRFAGGTTFYQVDAESDRDNSIFVMSREIKLDSIGFKSLQRVVVRGFFETKQLQIEGQEVSSILGLYIFGSYDSRKWACLGHRERTGTFTDIGCLVERTDCKFFRILLAGQLKSNSRLDYIEAAQKASVLNTKIR